MNDSETTSLDKVLYFTSIKNSSFDFSLPIKKNLLKFTAEGRAETSPYLFEYLCYKIAQKKISEKKVINPEISIISEKYLSLAIENKINSIKKKYVFIPIRNAISRKWNAVIFIHLEKQIAQYMKQINEEPIIAKIISSNINSEEDDYILNTTMDRIESTFNFSSPEDIQFEVDSINISDQPNTSVFLINFIEGLLEQDSDEDIMNYIMKLYDETSNTNAIGSNNYFISFNKENELFKDILQIYEKDLDDYMKSKGDKEDIKLLKIEEDDIDSEEEALKIIAKENEDIRKQMEEQERIFNMKMNDPNFRIDNDDTNYKNKNYLGQIQEADNESEDESDKRSNINNKSLKLSKSLKKRNDNNAFNDDKIKNMLKGKLIEISKEFKDIDNNKNKETADLNNNINNNININLNNEVLETKEKEEKQFNKEESIELNNIEQKNIIQNEENKELIKENDINEDKIITNSNDEDNEIKEENIVIKNSIISNSNNNIDNNDIKNEIIENNEIKNINENQKNEDENIDINKRENIDENNNIIDYQVDTNTNKETTDNQTLNKTEINNNENTNNSIEQINLPKFQNKTIEITSADINIKNNNIKEIHNSIRNSNGSNNSIYEKKKVCQKRSSFNKINTENNNNESENSKKYNNTNFYISKVNKENKENTNIKNIIPNKKEEKNIKTINNTNINDKNNKNIIFNKKKGIGKYKPNLPLVKKNIISKNENNNISNKNNIFEENKPFDKFEKNTIIINESSNNKTIVNIIGIKNNNQKNKVNDNYNDVDKIINNQNQIWNINISNHNKINLINNEKEETDYITKIPEDGTINPITSTLCANNTITDINNINNNIQEKTFKTISYIKNIDNKKNKNKLKEGKNDIVENKNDIKEILKENDNNINEILNEKNHESDVDNKIIQNKIRIDDENNIDVNMILNNNYKNRIQKMTTKKINYRNKSGNHGFFKEIEANDCTLDFTKDMKCGCNGGTDTGCNIF